MSASGRPRGHLWQRPLDVEHLTSEICSSGVVLPANRASAVRPLAATQTPSAGPQTATLPGERVHHVAEVARLFLHAAMLLVATMANLTQVDLKTLRAILDGRDVGLVMPSDKSSDTRGQ